MSVGGAVNILEQPSSLETGQSSNDHLPDGGPDTPESLEQDRPLTQPGAEDLETPTGNHSTSPHSRKVEGM